MEILATVWFGRILYFTVPVARVEIPINKAKAICECLVASEGIDLKFEEAFCSFLLGQGEEVVAAERLRELEISSGPTSRNFVISEKEINNVSGGNPSLAYEVHVTSATRLPKSSIDMQICGTCNSLGKGSDVLENRRFFHGDL
ncbi:hypothetical protein GIB67_003492 [Kingdonia uniflora]|uniref:Uncharacterized protein n=1 Tax=Kingdonia uniflora TaxID=39325 RepID=A0A7J7MER9_9MAGN|nr:hypothetical protein GIB67_003492 [Kingdonia uniflora]